MGIVLRQGFKYTVVSYVGVVIGTFNILYLSTRFLSPEQIGLTRFLVESSVLFTSFAQLGTTYIADKFAPDFKDDKKKHNGLFMFLLIYPLIGFVLFSLIFLLFHTSYINYYQNRSPLLVDYFYYIIPLTFFSMYLNVAEAYVRNHSRIVVPGIVKEIFLRASNCILIVLYGFELISFQQLVFGLIISFGLGVLILLLYIKQLNRLYFTFVSSVLTASKFKEMAMYGFFIVIGGLGSILAAKIDIMMLPAITNLNMTGIYVIALFIATVIEIPKRSISQISSPLISQAWKNNDLELIKKLYFKSSINLLLVGSIFFICIWNNIDAIFSVIPKSEIYQEGKFVVLFIALSKLIDMAMGVNSEIILNSKYYRVILIYVLVLAFLTITTNYIFIPIYGITGAAIAMAISIFVFTLIKLCFVWIKFKMHPFSNKTFTAIGIALITYAATYLIPSDSSSVFNALFNICLKSGLALVLFFGLSLFFKVSEDLNILWAKVYKKGVPFKKS